MNQTLFSRKAGTAALLAFVVAVTLVACKKPDQTPTPTVDAASAAAREEALAAKEQELAEREAALAAKEQEEEQVRLEAQAAADEAAAKAAAKASVKKPERAAPSTPPADEATVAAAKAAPVVKKVSVPAGTQLTIALGSALSSKTAAVGDPFDASVVSDVMVGKRVAVPAGTRVTGTITGVVSGSRAIGAVPMLGLKFDRLVLEDGQNIPVTGELVEQGKSEKARDTAKILGGAAAGAVLGHQVKKGDSGKVIGGLLGGAIGAVAAKKTGTEVTLAEGSTLTITTGEAFKVVPQAK
jgi:hypothetical protein